jgi:DNA-binding transcriptional LysR family regulator
MKLDQLSYFVEAARFESIGKAARRAKVSPSAISTSVRALERELGCALFVRRNQRIYLTVAGRALVARASAVLAAVDRLPSELANPELAYEGRYTVACARILASEIVADEWALFQAAHPRLAVEIQTLRSVEIVAKAATAEIDLGVCLDPAPHPEVESRRIGTSRYLVAVRRGHPLESVPRSALPGALSEFSACMPRSFTAAGSYDAPAGLERLDVRPRVDFAYDSYDVVFPRLRRSDAWALFPAFGSTRPKEITLLPLPRGGIPLAVAAVWPRRREMNEALRAFVDALAKRLGSRAARRSALHVPA